MSLGIHLNLTSPDFVFHERKCILFTNRFQDLNKPFCHDVAISAVLPNPETETSVINLVSSCNIDFIFEMWSDLIRISTPDPLPGLVIGI